MPGSDAALADLAESVGRALIRYAQVVRDEGVDTDNPAAEAAEEGPRGRLQRAVLALDGIASDRGLSAAEIAGGVGATQPNTYKLVERMIAGGWLEQVAGVEPRHWRAIRTEGDPL